jgi:benzodiazapine receptor
MIDSKASKGKFAIRFIAFLILNFLALAVGGLFTGKGVPSEWYVNLARAPWEPPGWVFGSAWTTIMLLFAVFMSLAWGKVEDRKVLVRFYSIQWILNILWNPLFFYLHWSGLALFEIILLTSLMAFITIYYWRAMKWAVLLLSPYVIWLCIATSLNAYAFFYN